MAGPVILTPPSPAYESSREWWTSVSEQITERGISLPGNEHDSFYRRLFALVASRAEGFSGSREAAVPVLHPHLAEYSHNFIDAWWALETEGTAFSSELIDAMPYLVAESIGSESLLPLPAVIGWDVLAGSVDARRAWQELVCVFANFIPSLGDQKSVAAILGEALLTDMESTLGGSWSKQRLSTNRWGQDLEGSFLEPE